ncbi:MAG: hypothetical protein ABIG61_06465 [Planctomycetota bacterium]
MKTTKIVFLMTNVLLTISATLFAQTLISIDPDNAIQGQNLSVTITGQDTHFKQGTNTGVWFSRGGSTINGDCPPHSSSDTILPANFNISVDAPCGSWDVSVWNSIDGTLTLSDGFTVVGNSPVLASISPIRAAQGQSLSVTITGLDTIFLDGIGTTDVWLSQGVLTINASGYSAFSNTSLSADFDIPADAVCGFWDVSVDDYYDGTLTLSNVFLIKINFDVWYVDNDAPNDPAPNNPDISDPLEDGSAEHPFDAIQEAIDWAYNGETVIVLEGTYTGTGNQNIDFLGKAITVRSTDPSAPCVVEATIIDCELSGRGFYFHSGENNDSLVSGLTILNGYASNGGGIYCSGSAPTISHCIIKNNEASSGGGICSDGEATGQSLALIDCIIAENIAEEGGGIYYRNNIPLIKNCVIAGNYAFGTSYAYGGGVSLFNSDLSIINSTIVGNIAEQYGGAIDCDSSNVTISNCIFWNNDALWGDALYLWEESTLAVEYSDIEGSQNSIHAASGSSVNWGAGMIDTYPHFAVDGYWDWGDWVDGDYHLKSDAGRWTGTGWVLDGVNSPCIDVGDPCAPVGVEPNPNGGRINMGAYGGTAEASKSPSGTIEPVCTGEIPGDANGDCKIDFEDFAIMAEHWLECNLDPLEACWE